MHTTPDTTEPTLRDLQTVMIRVQIKALETLERLMDDQELTGDEKVDKAKAIERNRQRLSATQTLVHCRAVQRELRERRELAHRIRQDERQAAKKAPHELASLRRLHKLHPDEYDNPDTPPSPLGGAWEKVACADSAQDRMRGRSEPSERPDHTTSGCAADPSPQPSPARGEGGQTPPSPLAGEGGRASDRMRGRSETSDRSDNTYPKPSPNRSRYKVRKPKHPRRSRKRKRGH